ncbi:MAG: hypothetical protein AB7F51_11320 [Pseudorhodoplanes sp.]
MRPFTVHARALRIAAVATLAAGGGAPGAFAATATSLSPAMTQMYAAVESQPPTAQRMMVCYGFVCRRKMFLTFSPGERATLSGILSAGRGSPEQERRALQRAFVWFDRRVAREIGTSRRVARADFRTGDAAHNFDCFDTTRNAVSLLLVFREWGLLRHHSIADPRYRGAFLAGQTPHNTAVLTEKKSGRNWVIDMWTTAYGQVPDVMPLERWLTEN